MCTSFAIKYSPDVTLNCFFFFSFLFTTLFLHKSCLFDRKLVEQSLKEQDKLREEVTFEFFFVPVFVHVNKTGSTFENVSSHVHKNS